MQSEHRGYLLEPARFGRLTDEATGSRSPPMAVGACFEPSPIRRMLRSRTSGFATFGSTQTAWTRRPTRPLPERLRDQLDRHRSTLFERGFRAIDRWPPRPPGAPGRLVAEAVDSSRIDLSWSAPRDDGGDMIAGYQIQFSADQGLSWSVLVVNTGSNETTYSDVDLAPGTTRYYRVLAINSVGPGTPSNVASATTDAVLPGAPLALNATAIGTSRIDLSWNPPDFNGGSPMIGYQIEVSADDGTTWSVLRAIPYLTNTTFAHKMLPPGDPRSTVLAPARRQTWRSPPPTPLNHRPRT